MYGYKIGSSGVVDVVLLKVVRVLGDYELAALVGLHHLAEVYLAGVLVAWEKGGRVKVDEDLCLGVRLWVKRYLHWAFVATLKVEVVFVTSSRHYAVRVHLTILQN